MGGGPWGTHGPGNGASDGQGSDLKGPSYMPCKEAGDFFLLKGRKDIQVKHFEQRSDPDHQETQ